MAISPASCVGSVVSPLSSCSSSRRVKQLLCVFVQGWIFSVPSPCSLVSFLHRTREYLCHMLEEFLRERVGGGESGFLIGYPGDRGGRWLAGRNPGAGKCVCVCVCVRDVTGTPVLCGKFRRSQRPQISSVATSVEWRAPHHATINCQRVGQLGPGVALLHLQSEPANHQGGNLTFTMKSEMVLCL
jgi:hypothetical protein